MPIKGQGWEFHVKRLGLHMRGGDVRTYGSYKVFLDGQPLGSVNGTPLEGFVCECTGPGANAPEGNGLRIEEGRYPLTTQFGRYRSSGYSKNTTIAAKPHMPAVRLEETGERTAILIHPGHPAQAGDPPFSFLSSVGCFNLTKALQPADDMEYFESRARVIAVIDSLVAFAPRAFRDAQGNLIKENTLIKRAFAVIDGEPMGLLQPDFDAIVVANN